MKQTDIDKVLDSLPKNPVVIPKERKRKKNNHQGSEDEKEPREMNPERDFTFGGGDSPLW